MIKELEHLSYHYSFQTEEKLLIPTGDCGICALPTTEIGFLAKVNTAMPTEAQVHVTDPGGPKC
jgi:hypothetical protein